MNVELSNIPKEHKIIYRKTPSSPKQMTWLHIVAFEIFLSVFCFVACGDDNGLDDFYPQNCASLRLETTVRIGSTNSSRPVDLAVDSVWSGEGFIVVWHSTEGIKFLRLDPLGNPIGEPSIISGTDGLSNWPSISQHGSNYSLAYSQITDSGNILNAIILDRDGQPITGTVQLTDGSSGKSDPKISVGEEEFGIVWIDDRHREPNASTINSELYFIAMDFDGTNWGNESRLTETESITLDPEIIYADGQYSVIYHEKLVEKVQKRHSVFLALVEGSGSLVDGPYEITELKENINDPYAAWSGENFAVVFTSDNETGAFTPNDNLEFTLVKPNGEILATNITLKNTDGISRPSVEWTGSWYSVSCVTGNEEGFALSIAAVSPLADGASTIMSEQLDNYYGALVTSWTGSSFGITYLSQSEDVIDTYFGLATCEEE